MKKTSLLFVSMMVGTTVLAQEPGLRELSASKDTFGRSNNRNGNSGGAPLLLLAPMPGVVSIISFDLTSVTNEIEGAEFSFQIQETSETPLSLTVAPMVHNEKNGKWIEGRGNFGIRGQNAEIGESSFQWRAFRDRSWLDNKGRSAKNLVDADVWESAVANLSDVEWTSGNWISVKIDDASFLEKIRTAELKTVTFGLWGTSGNGVYKINSKESGSPAKLNLNIKVPPKPVSED